MLLAQIALSAGAATLTIFLVALLLRDAPRHLAARIGAALFTCSLGYSLILIHETIELPVAVLQAAVFLNAFSLGLGWLFAQVLLDGRFRLGRWEIGIFVAISLLVLAADADVFGYRGSIWVVEKAAFYASIAVMAHLLWIALSSFKDDLINVRRLVRIWFVLFVLASFGVLFSLDAVAASPVWRGLVYDTTTIAISVSILLWSSQLSPERLVFQPEPPPLTTQPVVQPQDDPCHARLLDIVERQRAYRDPELSVGGLAERLGQSEHKLRAHINRTLGYENFAEFLNHYRLADASAALADPAQAHKSIFVIAMDAGYNSISSFNRAFKAKYAETPTSYRRRAMML
jgi:AraC-like DNA-binding protein